MRKHLAMISRIVFCSLNTGMSTVSDLYRCTVNGDVSSHYFPYQGHYSVSDGASG